ncbi:hypothetical protein [Gordonia malaquae]|uniref:hypothetical protein n=1 Tax=Gordonia malaquae TaxID=410332 RepID=UPI0030FE4EBE
MTSTIAYTLVGVDGSLWDLTEPSSIVRLVADPEGIGGPTTAAAWQENVGQGGATYKGQQDKIMAVGLKYRFGGSWFSEQELIDGAAAWRRALGTGEQLLEFHVVETIHTDGVGLPLMVPFELGGDTKVIDRWIWARNLDSHQGPPRRKLVDQGGWNQGSLTITSGSSRWCGDAAFLFKEEGDLSGHTLHNGGDYVAWPQWEITGPTSGLKIGLNGEQVALANIPAGSRYVIETNPSAPQVLLNGVDAWATAVGRKSWRVPAQPHSDVGVTIVGSARDVYMVLPLEFAAAIG